MKTPGVKVSRTAFLAETFGLMEEEVLLGKYEIGLDRRNQVARDLVHNRTLQSSAASFAAGIPGGLALAATIPADLAQNIAFSLRLGQELAYVYGYEDVSGDKDKLALFLGVMSNVQGADALLRATSGAAAKYAAKHLLIKPLMEAAGLAVLARVFLIFGGRQVGRHGLLRLAVKAVPVVGGAFSGAVTWATMRPAAERLRAELEKGYDYTEEQYLHDVADVHKQA